MTYPHWHELSPYDQWQSWRMDDIALGTRRVSVVPPLATARSQARGPVKRKHVRTRPGEGRSYLSRYVGVTQRRGRWMAQWGPRGATVCKVFSCAPEDELRAAQFRARALGLSEVEVRG